MTHATREPTKQKINKYSWFRSIVASSSLFCVPTTLSANLRRLLRRRNPMASNRWLRPEVYPLFAATGAAVGICALSLFRHITINPEVRVTKENRAAGVLDNEAEGKKYSEHYLRRFVRNKSPEIMPSINGFFTDPSRN